MASQLFKFPGFFDREIDLTTRVQSPVGTPAGVVGASVKGPAFVPVTVGSFADFITKFGDLDSKYPAPYAVEKFLDNRTALTFLRVLGAGSNATTSDIDATQTKGTVKNAGFKVSGTLNTATLLRAEGAVQFLVARHVVAANEAFGLPMFTNNDSMFTTGSLDEVYLTRGVIFAASDARVQLLSHDENWSQEADDVAGANATSKKFKLVVSSSAGSSFGNDEGFGGVRIFTASLDPTHDDYFAKVLNTDPSRFAAEKHLVYCDFAVDAEIAGIGTGVADLALASGSLNTSATSGDTNVAFQEGFGRFDTRYTTPRTTWFISQPFGETEHDLFYFELLSDGTWGNNKIKVSISGLQKSSNKKNKYGSFNVVVRAFDDTDEEPQILEQFSEVSLDPSSERFIGKAIGDKAAKFNFDSVDEADRRLITSGKFPVRSNLIRVVIHQQVLDRRLPEETLPFGFRGLPILSTNSLLVDSTGSLPPPSFGPIKRLQVYGADANVRLEGTLVPPVPFRFKVTRGDASTAGGLLGSPGASEIVDGRYYWGIKFNRNTNVLNPNVVAGTNTLLSSLVKFAGVSKLDMLVTGSFPDAVHNNKFTLARVALGNGAIADLTGSVSQHIREAAYIRNGRPGAFDYSIVDSGTSRITLATLLQKSTNSADFNKFSGFAKFTNVFYGGFDGTNLLDTNASKMDDRSTSTETRGSEVGGAAAAFVSPGLSVNVAGSGLENSTVRSFRAAGEIITDSIASNVNLVLVPGQRDPLVVDHVADKVRDFGLALFVMDVPSYDSAGDRIWGGETSLYPDIEQTARSLEGRALDNDSTAGYWPDVNIDDLSNNRRVTVPATIAALGAIGFNDKAAYPWFAPAGFNRASLDFVHRTAVKINQPERERLFEVNLNPIVKFPRTGYVIMSQETMEKEPDSALNSINVVRMLNELKRQFVEIGNRFIFEQIDSTLVSQLDGSYRSVLNTVTSRAGIDRYELRVTPDDENLKMFVQVVLVPTRAVENIAIDFIVTRSGVQFV
jgi:hypothetical protein